MNECFSTLKKNCVAFSSPLYICSAKNNGCLYQTHPHECGFYPFHQLRNSFQHLCSPRKNKEKSPKCFLSLSIPCHIHILLLPIFPHTCHIKWYINGCWDRAGLCFLSHPVSAIVWVNQSNAMKDRKPHYYSCLAEIRGSLKVWLISS